MSQSTWFEYFMKIMKNLFIFQDPLGAFQTIVQKDIVLSMENALILMNVTLEFIHVQVKRMTLAREIKGSNFINNIFLENARCINIVGSFRCKCIEGFEPNKRKISRFL